MKKFPAISRIIAFALVLCMCAAYFTTMPVVSFAADVTPGTITITPTSGSDITLSETETTAEVGGGTATYKVAENKIILDGISAKKIVFAMNGEFTVELVGKNSLYDTTSINRVFYVSKGNITFDGPGSLEITGTAATQRVFEAAGNINVAGGEIRVIADNCANAFRSDSNITVSGGSLYVLGNSEAIRCSNAGKAFTMTGGKVEVNSDTNSNNIYSQNVNISGGELIIKGALDFAIRATAGPVNITGGTVDITIPGSHAICGVGGVNISEANVGVPTNIKLNVGGSAFCSHNTNTKLSITGGRITGTCGVFARSDSVTNAITVEIGNDAIIDCEAKTMPIEGSAVTLNVGDIWEEGKDLSSTEAAQIKTLKQRPVVDAAVTGTVTVNDKAQAGVTVGFYNGGEEVATAITDENGQVTFTVEDLLAGYTYTGYTMKQIAEDGNGYVYDLEEKDVSIFVNSVGDVVSETTFENTYNYITVTPNEGEAFDIVDGTPVEIGGGTITYDVENAIVTLNNVTAKSIAFNLHKNFTLEIVEDNTIGDENTTRVINVVTGDITVTGTGNLNVVAKSEAIYVAVGSYTQTGATLDVDAKNGVYSLRVVKGNIAFTDCAFDGYSSSYWGIRAEAGSITITDATVTSSTTANNICAAKDLTVNSGTVTAHAWNAGIGEAANCVLRSYGTMNLLGGTISAISDNRAINASGKLTVSPDAKLILENKDAEESRHFVYGSLEETGVRYVTGLSFADNGLKVETLVEGEKDYNLPGNADVVVNVTLNDEADNGREVQLLKGEEVIATATVADGKVTFPVSVIGEGEHTYTVKVVGENGNGYTFAEAQTVTLTVAQNGTTVAPEEITLANTYVAPSADVTIDATVNGKDATVELWNGDEKVAEALSVDGEVSFTQTLDAGEYTFTLKIADTDANGWIYDKDVKTITVIVANGEATIDGEAIFTNTYKAASVTATIGANVTLNGEVSDKNFVIVIDGEEIAVVDGKASVVKEYTAAGTYYITLTQKNTGLGGVTYDNAECLVTVTVTDNGEGQLVAEVGENNPTFNNTYDYVVDTDVTINATVSVTDRTLAEGDVIANLWKGEEIIATGMIDADGNVVFTIDASKDMAGDYTIALSTEIAGITLPEAQTITVTVVDNGDGTATVAATETELTFKGSYKAPTVAGEIKDVNGKLTYVSAETGKGVELGLVKIGDNHYYVGPNGVLMVNQKYYAWKLNENSEFVDGWYAFGEDGKMIKEGIFNGYFYENYLPTEKGLIKIGEDYYYAGPNGKLVVDQRYYAWKVDENCDLGIAYYRFDATGKMIGASAEGEIVDINGVLYYYRSGKPTEMGLFKYTDGNYYVAQYNGMIITANNYTQYGAGKYYVWKIHESANDKNVGWYFFDEAGKMITE